MSRDGAAAERFRRSQEPTVCFYPGCLRPDQFSYLWRRFIVRLEMQFEPPLQYKTHPGAVPGLHGYTPDQQQTAQCLNCTSPVAALYFPLSDHVFIPVQLIDFTAFLKGPTERDLRSEYLVTHLTATIPSSLPSLPPSSTNFRSCLNFAEFTFGIAVISARSILSSSLCSPDCIVLPESCRPQTRTAPMRLIQKIKSTSLKPGPPMTSRARLTQLGSILTTIEML